MNGNPMTIHEEYIRNLLAEFMDEIEEWSSNVAGSPTPQELQGLDDIYDDYIVRLDTAYDYNQKASIAVSDMEPKKPLAKNSMRIRPVDEKSKEGK